MYAYQLRMNREKNDWEVGDASLMEKSYTPFSIPPSIRQ